MIYKPEPMWAFAWESGNPRPFITPNVSLNRGTLIRRVAEELGEPWKKIYRRGGRAIKVTVSERSKP